MLSPPAAQVAGVKPPISAASICAGARGIGAFSQTFPRWGRHDVWLIAEAVRAEVNKARCAAGLSRLAPDQTLIRAAEVHTSDMIARAFFDHLSPVPGRRTPSDRIAAAGGQSRLTAENLAQAWYLNYESGRSFYTHDADACRFTYTDGTTIQRHTYATLAKDLVAASMGSPGHRENILRSDVSLHGLAVGPTGDAALCGGLYATQLFAG
ncbi:MAG: CAP domain-containing protein [Pseudomonadota bacterium]